MAAQILDGTELQHGDYWTMMDRLVDDDGGLRIGELLSFQNEHPVVIGQLLYLANAYLGNGSNIVLGFVVIGIAAGQVVIVTLLARTTMAGCHLTVAATALVASACVYAPQGLWSFFKSMSGAAWLPANLFCLLALLFAASDRRIPAIGAAVGASISYGTGILTWPALALTTMVRSRRWWPPPETVVGFIITGLWYRTSGKGAGNTADAVDLLFQIRLVPRFAGLILPGGSTTRELVGWAVVLAGLWLSAAHARRGPIAAPWIGLLAYSLGALALIARGRATFTYQFGLQDRYVSIAALVWISVFGLFMTWLAARSRGSEPDRVGADVGLPAVGVPWFGALIAASLTAVLATSGGQARADLLAALRNQNLLEVAFLADVADGTPLPLGLTFPPVTDAMRAIDHYPFDGGSFDCGLVGTTLDRRLDDATVGIARGPREWQRNPAVLFDIWLLVDFDDVECVLVVDGDLVVIGAGYEIERLPSDGDDVTRRYQALASTADAYAVLALLSDGAAQMFELRPSG